MDGDGLRDIARRGFETTFGVAVLVVQNAQVGRRELAKQAPRLFEEVGERVKMVGEKLADLDERADDIYDQVEQHFPEGLRPAARDVHDVLRELRAQARTITGW